MIPSPNLDDRTHKEIVEEAVRLIPHYCPEWTNHNPTDPGITLIELFAWMIEMLIYRLNRVPEKTYLVLLDMLGLSYTNPQASRVLLTFTPVEKYEGEVILKKGIQVSTSGNGSNGPVIFETERTCPVKNISVTDCISTFQGRVTNNLISQTADDGFSLFSGTEEIERYIYICDSSFEYLNYNNFIDITFKNANEIKSSTLEIVNYLQWEYWNGKKWLPIEYHKTILGRRRRDNTVYFKGPVEICPTSINGMEGYFLRAALTSLPDKEQCFELLHVSSNLIFLGQGLQPDDLICNTDNMVFNHIDISKDFKPFLEIPKYNDALYIASEEVFSKTDSVIFIDIKLSDAENSQSEPGDKLILKFEFWNGFNWAEIGTTTVKGVIETQGKYRFKDQTKALTQNGRISFARPKELEKTEVNGQESYWIRIRIGAGDFGTGGQYQIDEQGKWIWSYTRPVKPPVLSQISLFYEAPEKPVNNLIVYYDFTYNDLSDQNIENYSELSFDEESKVKYFPVIKINKEKNPITYFGFSSRFPDKDFAVYFRIKERRKTGYDRPDPITDIDDSTSGYDKKNRSISLRWEYWNGYAWINLIVNDYTDNFHESGFISFNCPDDLKVKKEFGKDTFWIRLIHESGSFEINPRILAIHLNSVYAINYQTHINELLGSSSGALNQEYPLLHAPLLPGLELFVRENDLPTSEERDIIYEEEGIDAISIKKNSDSNDEIWIRYHKVPNFYASSSKSRHYMVDYINNKIIFGNGINGIIPPRLKNNIKAVKYYSGGGTSGNIGHNTINILRENIPYIAEVSNHYPAEGGSDIESLEELKKRASRIFKNLNRAVTAEDYEWLAKEASSSVARAKCLSKVGKAGEIILLVLPHPDSKDFDITRDLYPTSELLRRVRDYLSARKLVGTKLKVESPVYRSITINLKVVLKKDISETQLVLEQIDIKLRRYLHPVTGGALEEGWEFGMPLTKNDIFSVLDAMDSIHFIEEIQIIDNATGMAVDKFVIDEDSLISVKKINIQERKNQF